MLKPNRAQHLALGVGVWQFDSAVYFGHDFHRDHSTTADYQKRGCVPTLGNQINLLTIVGGVAVTLMMLMHGLNFIWPEDHRRLAGSEHVTGIASCIICFSPAEVVFAVLLFFFMTDFFKERPISTLLILVVIVGSTVAAHIGV